MKVVTLLVAVIALGLSGNAQGTLDKITRGIYDAERAHSTFGKLKGILGKKKPKESITVTSDTINTIALAGTKKTILTIEGIDFTRLKKLNDNVRACSAVQSANMKYGSQSTIEIMHTGSTGEMMKLINETCKDIFSEKNVVAFEEGKVTLKI